MYAIVNWDVDSTFSIITLKSIADPRKPIHEYAVGDRVVAPFGGKNLDCKIFEIRESRAELNKKLNGVYKLDLELLMDQEASAGPLKDITNTKTKGKSQAKANPKQSQTGKSKRKPESTVIEDASMAILRKRRKSEQLTPSPQTNQVTPPPQTDQVTSSPQTNQVTPPPQTDQVTPSPQTNQLTPPPQSNQATPPPQTNQLTSPLQTNQLTSPPQTNQVTQPLQTNQLTSPPQTNQVTQPPQTNQLTQPPQTNQLTPPPQTNQVIPQPQTNQLTPPPQTNQLTPPPQTNQQTPLTHQTVQQVRAPQPALHQLPAFQQVSSPGHIMQQPPTPQHIIQKSPTTQPALHQSTRPQPVMRHPLAFQHASQQSFYQAEPYELPYTYNRTYTDMDRTEVLGEAISDALEVVYQEDERASNSHQNCCRKIHELEMKILDLHGKLEAISQKPLSTPNCATSPSPTTPIQTAYSSDDYEVVHANRLHLTSLVNRIDQQEGADMKESIRMEKSSPTYFTQYNRIHNKLGTMLGPGVSREFPVRQEYNVITGETGGAAWREDNRRISGDKVLYNMRREQTSILG